MRWRALRQVRVLGALTLAVAISVGCGGSGPTHESSGGAIAELRLICLESREGGTNAWRTGSTCREAGITASEPPPSSTEARVAARHSARAGEHLEAESAEEPSSEMQKRAAAVLDFAEGRRGAAEREFEEGCPKADTTEIADAWSKLRRLAQLAHSVAALRKGDEELCPL